MRRRFLLVSLLPLLPLVHVGCNGSKTDFWLPANDLLPMVALDDRVAYVERNSHTAFILDPADASLFPRMEGVGTAPVAAVKRNGSNQMLVLSYGDSGSADKAAIPAQLDIVDASAASAVYPLAGRFDGLAQSVDGRFAVLYHSSSTQTTSDTGLFNPNEMTIVDFTPPANPSAPLLTSKSIRSLGGVPTRIEFSPPFAFSGGARTLAVVLSQNYVTILDLEHADRTEISVPLCPQSSGCNFSPDQILFDPASLDIYVRAGNAMDIFQIALTDLGPAAATGTNNDFHASLSMLSVGANPASMVLYGSGAATRLAVVAPANRSLVVIDPSTSHTLAIATSIPANTIVPFTVSSPTGMPKYQAMLVDTLLGSTSVLFADLELVETTGGLSLTDYALSTSASAVQPLVDQGIAVLVAGRYAAGTAFTVVDLATRSFNDIGAGSQFGSPYFETRTPSRLWSAYEGSGLSYLNLVARGAQGSLVTNLIWLDQYIVGIHALNQTSTDGHRYLAVEQNDPNAIGNLTFLDADAPDRATARTAYGFLFSDYLERGQP